TMSCCPKPKAKCCCYAEGGSSFRQCHRAPFIDAVGPYPDEIIMSVLDRILCLVRADKIIRSIAMVTHMEPPTNACCPPPPTLCCPPTRRSSSTCASVCSTKTLSSSMKTCNSQPPSSCCGSCFSPRSPCLKRISAASCCPRQRVVRVDFDHPAEVRTFGGGCSTVKKRIERSLSTCSVACQQLKEKLVPKDGAKCKDHTWLWTRMMDTKEGYKMYEVFKNSKTGQPPSTAAGDKDNGPLIVFMMTPNGYIMPFESVSS
ncbi:hypothetical protein KR018_005774, partial [Drosophila ironensis]